MKHFTTIICSLIFAFCGAMLAFSGKDSSPSFHGQTISAAPVLHTLPGLPLDLQLDLEKKYKSVDTVYVDGGKDTVFVDRIITKRPRAVGWAEAKRAGRQTFESVPPDEILRELSPEVVREEQTTDTIGPPKVSIILTVDGKEVYKR